MPAHASPNDIHPPAQTDTDTNTNPPPSPALSADLTYFSTIPLAYSTLADPSFIPYSISRTLTDPTGPSPGHSLMASTWNTPATIPRLLSMYRPGYLASNPSQTPELRRFYIISHGLNSHPKLLHGGVLSTILDSTMSNLAGYALRDYLETKGEGAAGERPSVVTVQLNVGFLKGVKTPGCLRVRSWVKGDGRIVEGEDGRGARKVWVEAVVESDQDCEGEDQVVVHAKAEGLWLRIAVDANGHQKGKL